MQITRLEDIRNNINQSNVSMFSLRKEAGEYITKEIPINEDMVLNLKEIGKNTLDMMEKWAIDLNKETIAELSLEDEVTKVFYVPMSEVETYSVFKEKILQQNNPEGNLRQEENIKVIKSFIIHYEYQGLDGQIKFINLFQKFSASALFHRRKFMSIYIDGEYQAITSDTFSLEEYGAVIAIEEDSKLLVRDKDSFEKIFAYEEAHKEFTTSFFDSHNNAFINIEAIRDKVINSKSYCREIYKVSKSGRHTNIYIPNLERLNENLNLNLNIENGIWNIGEHDKLDIVFKIMNRGLAKDALIQEDEFILADSFKSIRRV